jgi:hypothetical protein
MGESVWASKDLPGRSYIDLVARLYQDLDLRSTKDL